jgi:hypothetical protein
VDRRPVLDEAVNKGHPVNRRNRRVRSRTPWASSPTTGVRRAPGQPLVSNAVEVGNRKKLRNLTDIGGRRKARAVKNFAAWS